MRVRRMFFSLVIAGAMLATLYGSGSSQADPVDLREGRQPGFPHYQEVLDDPPGIPALPVPGAPRAMPVTFGSFSSVQVNVDSGGANIPGDAGNETSIAVNPNNPNFISIGWRQFDTVSSNFRQAGRAYSTDGGRSWTFPGVLDGGTFQSDPVLDFDAAGNFYYNSLRTSPYECMVYKSSNGGYSWEPEVYAYGGDKQWMTVDRTSGVGAGNIYATWVWLYGCCSDNIFTRSVNGGNSFQFPVDIPNSPFWGTLAVGPSGEVYSAGGDANDYESFRVARSDNARIPLSTPTFTVSGQVNMGGDHHVSNISNGPNPGGLIAQTYVAVDSSGGPRNGFVYLLATVDPPGSDVTDIMFVRSEDGGNTWSSPVQVNDNDAGNDYQWFGTMSVSPNGRIDVVWNDTRNSGQANISQLFYSSSSDGGVTWSASQQLSPSFNSWVGWPNQNKMGDYYDMISDDVGAHLAWAATFNGEQDVYYLRIGDYDCNGNGIGDSLDISSGGSNDVNSNGIPDECEGIGLQQHRPHTLQHKPY